MEVASRDRTWPIVWKSLLIAVGLFVVGVAVVYPRAVLNLILPDQTVYATGFSEEKFGEVRPGMDAQRVVGILGEPLEVVIEPADRQTYKVLWSNRPSTLTGVRRWWWDYSRPGRNSDSYRVRSVEMNVEGKVVQVLRHYYQD